MLTSSLPTHEPSSRDPTTTNTCLKRRRKTSRHGLDDCFAVLRMAGRQFVNGLFPSAPEPSRADPSRAHLYQYDPVSLFGDPDPANATSSEQAHCTQSSCGHEWDCDAAAAAADEVAVKPPAAAATAAKPKLPTAAPARTTLTRLKTKSDVFSSYSMLNLIGTDDMAGVSACDDAAPGLATLRRSGVASLRDHPPAGVGDGAGVRMPMVHPLRRRHSSVMNVSYRWNIPEADAIEIMMAVEAASAGQSNQ